MASGVERQNGVQLSAFSFEIAPSLIRPLSSDVRPISACSLQHFNFSFPLSTFCFLLLMWAAEHTLVATNTKRYEQRLQSDLTEQSQMKAVDQLLNCEI